MFRLSALTAGVILDWIFGDPGIFYHPVCMIGNLISRTEKTLRRRRPGKDRTNGLCLVLTVLLVSIVVPGAVLWLIVELEGGPGIVSWLLSAFWCFQLLAAKGLYQESGKVKTALEGPEDRRLFDGRRQVSMIVGRDTERLDEDGVIRAAVETVAENTSDGVIAPLLYIAVFGVLGGFFYKAVNTMDSMIGYKNEKYRIFGRAAARLDDFCNLIPARVTGFLMTAAAFLLQPAFGCYDGANAWRIFLRDRKNHASPNSAHGEAACAGALHIRLAGDAWYFGTLYKKPDIGDADREVEPEDIRRAGRLMFAAELLALLGCWMVWALWIFWRKG